MWSQKAREAAAAARKRKGANRSAFKNTAKMPVNRNTVPPSINLAQSSTTKHKPGERTSANGRAVYKPKTQPHKAIPNAPVSHSIANGPQSTGQQAFTQRAHARLAPAHYTPIQQAATHRTNTKVRKNQPVIAGTKRYPSSKRKKGK